MTVHELRLSKYLRYPRASRVPWARWRYRLGLLAGLLSLASLAFFLWLGGAEVFAPRVPSSFVPHLNPYVIPLMLYAPYLRVAGLVCATMMGAWCAVQLWRTSS